MGADLYIEPEYTKVGGFEKENNPYYYRDSYNDSNLMWTVKLSYWSDMPVNKQDRMSPAACKKWLALFDSRKAQQVMPTPGPNETAEDVRKYFSDKEKLMREFFALAIKLKRSVICSI